MFQEFYAWAVNTTSLINLIDYDFAFLGFDFRYAIYALIFLGVLVAFEGLRQLLSFGENNSEARNRRMRMMQSGKTEEQILDILKPKTKKGLLSNLPFVDDLPAAMRTAGMTTSPGVFATLCASGFVAVAALGSTITHPVMAFAVGILVFLLLPLIYVDNVRKQRMDKLVKQLPDALDLMARGLKVGHPLNATLKSVADEMPDPIGSEFGVVIDQIAYGDDLGDAMRDLAVRVPEEDIQYLAVAVGIQHGTGGDLARILATLAAVIRGRMTMRRRIRAISSEGRLSAIFLSCLPVFIAIFTSVTAPRYYGDVADSPLFIPVAITIVVLVIANALILRKLVTFRF